jgi:hypothetical protein
MVHDDTVIYRVFMLVKLAHAVCETETTTAQEALAALARLRSQATECLEAWEQVKTGQTPDAPTWP